jgi:hypothetical protein
MDFSQLKNYIQARYKDAGDYSDKLDADTNQQMSNIYQKLGATPEEAGQRIAETNDLAQKGGMTMGAINPVGLAAPIEAAAAEAAPGAFQKIRQLFQSPEAAGRARAKAGMSAADPVAQRLLAQELSTGLQKTKVPTNFGKIIYK